MITICLNRMRKVWIWKRKTIITPDEISKDSELLVVMKVVAAQLLNGIIEKCILAWEQVALPEDTTTPLKQWFWMLAQLIEVAQFGIRRTRVLILMRMYSALNC